MQRLHLQLGAHLRMHVAHHVDAQAHVDPGREQVRHPGHTLRQPHVVGRAMGHMGAPLSQQIDLGVVEDHAMSQNGALGEETGPVQSHDR